MKFSSYVLPAVLATTAVASPVTKRTEDTSCECLTDDQAYSLVQQFKSILTNPDRSAANATAQVVIADGYVETSDSINSLAGYPLGGPSFVGKETYSTGITYAPAIPTMEDLLIFHDCQYITWYWLAFGIGDGAEEVKGINIFNTTADRTQISMDYLEFNSIAWGIDDQQVTNTPPPPPGRR